MLDKSCDTFEADVVARVTKKGMSGMKRFLRKYGADVVSPGVIDDLCEHSLGLVVMGRATSIGYKGKAKYLDGDIWIAGEDEGIEFFETAFIDIGDPKDREDALGSLRARLEERRGRPRLVSQYDDASRLAATLDSPADIGPLEKIFRYGLEPAPRP